MARVKRRAQTQNPEKSTNPRVACEGALSAPEAIGRFAMIALATPMALAMRMREAACCGNCLCLFQGLSPHSHKTSQNCIGSIFFSIFKVFGAKENQRPTSHRNWGL